MLSLAHALDDMMAPSLLGGSCPYILARPTLKRQSALQETDNAFQLTATVPGISRKNIKVLVEVDEDGDSHLRIEGKTKRADQLHSVAKRLLLPEDADSTAATAEHSDGILTVHLPKKARTTLELPIQPGNSEESATDEHDEAYQFSLTLPGIRTADLKATVDGGVLTVEGETTSDQRCMSVFRRFELPKDVALESIHFEHADGILMAKMPKRKAAALAAVRELLIADSKGDDAAPTVAAPSALDKPADPVCTTATDAALADAPAQ